MFHKYTKHINTSIKIKNIMNMKFFIPIKRLHKNGSLIYTSVCLNQIKKIKKS